MSILEACYTAKILRGKMEVLSVKYCANCTELSTAALFFCRLVRMIGKKAEALPTKFTMAE
jgi:hypothetical protein